MKRMKDNYLMLLYFIGVTIVNLYPIYISLAIVGLVNQSGHNIDGWIEVTLFLIGLTFLALIISFPIYIIGWQIGQSYFSFFQTRTYTILMAVALIGLTSWYMYTAVRLY
ncbi:hypothetical protein SAMN05216498_1998 [Tenuibacillus multivorans]|uniref:Uncharacterized protein n=2 Tax=Tenuibacillus multivorans TaxID=237069 RepID=A0A1H0AM57_9BACI|nr:hypothetical protein SAMN05216498_1998 [Tenuibacillus multivorans]